MNASINAIHIVTFVGEVGTIVLSSILFRALMINSSYLRRECGNQIKAIVLVSILCGLSSLPSSIVLFSNNNTKCPHLLVSLMALPRVFSFRFEVSQYTCMSLDRAASTILPRSYHKRMRKVSLRISLAVSAFLSLVESVMYLFQANFYKVLDHCNILEAGGSSYEMYFFLTNIICLAIVVTCYVFYIHDTRQSLKTSSVSTMITVKLVLNLVGFFIITFGAGTTLFTINRVVSLPFLRNTGHYMDAFLQFQHVIMFFIFCFTIDNKRLKQVSIASTATTQTGVRTPRLAQTKQTHSVEQLVIVP